MKKDVGEVLTLNAATTQAEITENAGARGITKPRLSEIDLHLLQIKAAALNFIRPLSGYRGL